MRKGQGRFGGLIEVLEPKIKQKYRSNHTLQKKASARPTVGKCREQALQEHPFFVSSLGCSQRVHKDPIEAFRLRHSGDLQFDNSALQPDRDRMSPVLGAELREYVRDVALHTCFADRQLTRNLFIGVSTGD